MKIMKIKQELSEILDNIGIYIEQIEDDVDLTEYIADSLQFIAFVVEVEKVFGISYPDDMLTHDCLKSMNSFAMRLNEIIEQAEQS